jgi:hypothetical protein
VLLCAALMRNEAEGFPGRYYGTDISLDAGLLLSEPYSSVGTILYGDSIRSLQSISNIDLFITDSDHSAQYERREYETIAPKLSPRGIILGDNCHNTDVLADFPAERHQQFIPFGKNRKTTGIREEESAFHLLGAPLPKLGGVESLCPRRMSAALPT